MLYILLVLTIGLANFAIGFALAVHFGTRPGVGGLAAEASSRSRCQNAGENYIAG